MSRYEQIRLLVDQVLDLPTQERVAALKRCTDVEPSMLAEALELLACTEEAAADEFLSRPALGSGLILDSAPSAEPAPEIPGHDVIRPLGGGSTGSVYLARSRELGREVAVKVLRSGMSESSQSRFLREQQLLAQVNHPGVAQVYGAGRTEDGRPFTVVEYVDGPMVTDFIAAQQSSLADRLRPLASVCEAVHHIHQSGVIHRDLKPENILVSSADGGPKVIDFGASALIDVAETQTVGPRVIGTIAYMAPEQLGTLARADVRSDVFALGVITHELIAAEHPFGGRDRPLGDVVRAIQTERRPAIQVPRRELQSLNAVLDKACAKRPADRYPSAQHLADELQRTLLGVPVEVSEPGLLAHARSATRRRPMTSIGVGLVLCTISLLSGLLLVASAQNREQAVQLQSTVDVLVDGVLGEINELSGAGPARERLARLLLDRLDAVPARDQDRTYHMQRAQVLGALSAVMLADERIEPAVGLRRQALSDFETFFTNDFLDSEVSAERIHLQILLGDALHRAGELDECYQFYTTAHEMIASNVDRFPDEPRWKRDLTWSYERLVPFVIQESPDEALGMCHKRLVVASEISADDPEHPANLFSLGCAEAWLSEVYIRRNNWSEAERYGRLAVESLGRAVEGRPNRFAYRTRWIGAQVRLARALYAGDAQELGPFVIKAIGEAESLFEENSGAYPARMGLVSLLELGIRSSPRAIPEELARSYVLRMEQIGHVPPDIETTPYWLYPSQPEDGGLYGAGSD